MNMTISYNSMCLNCWIEPTDKQMEVLLRIQRRCRRVLMGRMANANMKWIVEWLYAPDGPYGKRDRLVFSEVVDQL